MAVSPLGSNILVYVRSEADEQPQPLPSVSLWRVNQSGEQIKSFDITESDPNHELRFTLLSRPCLVGLEDGGALVLARSETGGLYLVRTDQAGKTVSVKQLALPASVFVECLTPTRDGNLLLIGQINHKALAMKIDTQGKIIWQNAYDYGRYEHFTSALPPEDGGYVFVGDSVMPRKTAGGQSEVLVVKCDALGKKQRDRTFPGRDAKAVRTQEGDYAVIYEGASDSDRGIWVRVLDEHLNELWRKQVLPAEDGTGGFSIVNGCNGGYIIAGMRRMMFFMAELDRKGKELWSFTDDRQSRSFMCLDLIATQQGALACTSFLSVEGKGKPRSAVGLLKFACGGVAR
jgi:hypothetical protein